MFFGYIEKELLWEVIYFNWQNPKFSENLQLQIEQEKRQQDIWEDHSQNIQEGERKHLPKKA